MNLGLTQSLNRGIDLSRADYIARIDADDLAHPERFKRQFDFLEKNQRNDQLKDLKEDVTELFNQKKALKKLIYKRAL